MKTQNRPKTPTRSSDAPSPKSAPAAEESNTEKDPSDWTTGGEPMTGAQKSYLKTLSEEAGVPFEDTLTKADASKKIDELKQANPRTAD